MADAGSVITCAGTGQDGEFQAGTAQAEAVVSEAKPPCRFHCLRSPINPLPSLSVYHFRYISNGIEEYIFRSIVFTWDLL